MRHYRGNNNNRGGGGFIFDCIKLVLLLVLWYSVSQTDKHLDEKYKLPNTSSSSEVKK